MYLRREQQEDGIDALPLYKKYSDVFLYTDVPKEERQEVARQVADKIIAILEKGTELLASEGQWNQLLTDR
jgi:hypothetical protein